MAMMSSGRSRSRARLGTDEYRDGNGERWDQLGRRLFYPPDLNRPKPTSFRCRGFSEEVGILATVGRVRFVSPANFLVMPENAAPNSRDLRWQSLQLSKLISFVMC